MLDKSLKDNDLVALAKEGDMKALGALMEKYDPILTQVLRKYVKDLHELQDIKQDVFCKLMKSIDKFRGDSAFYTWLYRIAVNTAKNYLLSYDKRNTIKEVDMDKIESSLENIFAKDTENPELFIEYSNTQESIFHIMDKLPLDLRTSLILRDFEGLTYNDISYVMGCPLGTIKSRIFRAREFIMSEVYVSGNITKN
tara:strand:- start:37234 stop:37824 length:591 start_codon:yes stop_codon:yes gene_type:complete